MEAVAGPSSSGGSGRRDVEAERLCLDSARDGDTACVVCMCDYEDGEDIMQLPCKHCFHAACIKPWLSRNATCPLCKQAVWEPLPMLLLPLWAELLQEPTRARAAAAAVVAAVTGAQQSAEGAAAAAAAGGSSSGI